MTFTGFLLQLAFTTLIGLPNLTILYFVIRAAIKHGLADAAKIARQQPQPLHRAINE